VLVRNFIEKLGVKYGWESEEGKGSDFNLPYVELILAYLKACSIFVKCLQNVQALLFLNFYGLSIANN